MEMVASRGRVSHGIEIGDIKIATSAHVNTDNWAVNLKHLLLSSSGTTKVEPVAPSRVLDISM